MPARRRIDPAAGALAVRRWAAAGDPADGGAPGPEGAEGIESIESSEGAERAGGTECSGGVGDAESAERTGRSGGAERSEQSERAGDAERPQDADRTDAIDRRTLATAVRFALEELAACAPGRAVEVRVPPYGVTQAVAGTVHRRGTPPSVVETDAETWLALATGRLTWADAVAGGALRASGERCDLSAYLPLLRA